MPSFNFLFLNLIFSKFFFFEAEDMAISLHNITSFAISILLNFLLLKYQNTKESPFDTNPGTILFGVSCLLLYSFTIHFEQRISMVRGQGLVTLANAIHSCTLLFGSLSVACLASLLFPGSASPVIFVLCILNAVGDVLPWLYRRIRTKIREAHFQLQLQILPL